MIGTKTLGSSTKGLIQVPLSLLIMLLVLGGKKYTLVEGMCFAKQNVSVFIFDVILIRSDKITRKVDGHPLGKFSIKLRVFKMLDPGITDACNGENMFLGLFPRSGHLSLEMLVTCKCPF